jgi:hypothetical protein
MRRMIRAAEGAGISPRRRAGNLPYADKRASKDREKEPFRVSRNGGAKLKTCNLASPSPYRAMGNFNYSASAELFGSAGRQRRSVTYRRFASGAEAVKFAVEGKCGALIAGVILQTDDNRFDHLAIRALYESASYPLTRQHEKASREDLQLVSPPTARVRSAG